MFAYANIMNIQVKKKYYTTVNITYFLQIILSQLYLEAKILKLGSIIPPLSLNTKWRVDSEIWGKQVKYRFLDHARLCSIFLSIQQYTKVLLKKWRDNLVSYPVQMMVTFKDSTNATLIAMYDPVRWIFCNYVDSIIKVVKWKTSLI